MTEPNQSQHVSGALTWFGDRFRDASVLVTGHTGFKGSWLCRWLMHCGAEVHGYALDPPPHATLYNQLGLANEIAGDHRGDLSDRSKLRDCVHDIGPKFVFHLAAQPLVRYSYETPVETIATNVMGTTHLLDSLRGLTSPCTAVVVTTDKCYANQEWLHGYREVDPLGGKDPYSASKAAAEIVTSCYRDSFFSSGPIRIASARAGNVIGGGDWALDRIVPDCINALRTGKSIPVRNRHSTRPWQHVLEPLSGYLWLAAELDRQSANGELDSAFNFGPNLTSNQTVEALVRSIIRHHGEGDWRDESDPTAAHEATRLDLSIAKAHHQLGWQPIWDFEQTVAQTVDWYRREQQGQDMASVTSEQICAYANDASVHALRWATTSSDELTTSDALRRAA